MFPSSIQNLNMINLRQDVVWFMLSFVIKEALKPYLYKAKDIT